MIRSMTGFGRCLVDSTHVTQQWEVKSVNGRHLDIKWYTPSSTRSLHTRWEKIVRQYAQRGRVELSLMLKYEESAVGASVFDAAGASVMLDALHHLAYKRKEIFTPDYNRLLAVPLLWNKGEEDVEEGLAKSLDEGLTLALKDWNEARSAEGQALAVDIHSRILRMEAWASLLEERAPSIKEERIQTVHERVQEILMRHDVSIDEGRFLQEVTVLADRSDVSEELTRLTTHLNRLRELLQEGKDAGRRLDFTLQECFREINTCGNKIPDVQLSRVVVDFKNELEKCREQVQNLE